MGYYGGMDLFEAIMAANNGYNYRMAVELVGNAYASAGIEGVKQVAAENGISYLLAPDQVTPAWFTVQSMQGVSATSTEMLYPAVVDTTIDTTTHELVIQTTKSVTTQGGSRLFSAGAVKAATSALALVGAVATGAKLGWDSYKEHPDFWTDLGNAIFDSADPDGPVEVLARAHAGGYTTAVKEKQVCKILQNMAAQGCFDYQDVDTTVTDIGVQDLTFSEINPQGAVCAMAWNKASDLYPGTTCIQIRPDLEVSQNIYQGYVWVADLSTLPTSGNISSVNDATGHPYYYINVPCYQVSAQYDSSTETYTYTNRYSTFTIVSDTRYIDTDGGFELGGLNVDITEYTADNQLFTNDHDPSNLQLAPVSTFEQIKNKVKEYFPAWYDESWLQPEYNPETGNVDDERYYPVTIPWWDPVEDTDTPPDYTPDVARRGDVEPAGSPKAIPQWDNITKNNPKYEDDPRLQPPAPVPVPTPTPEDPGAGGGGSASGLWAVYNPTVTELNQLGAYLWTSNIIELLEKFLQNPMDAIISLHRIYCTPTTGAAQHIILGYLDSNVSADTVTNQFVTVNCGTVSVPEFFGDCRDYDAPYTLVEAYLPFIGIVRLRTEDVIGGVVNIVYEVDVYSGACLCKIFITKLGAKQLLYNYSGNCSMQIPLTGGDRTRLLSGALTGAVAGAAAAGPVGAIVGGVAGAFKGGSSVDRSGGFSANAACMGIKKPYLIITRKYAYDAGNYNHYYGFPSNITVSLSTCKGYTRVKNVHIDIAKATVNEKREIETLLKEGVIIN